MRPSQDAHCTAVHCQLSCPCSWSAQTSLHGGVTHKTLFATPVTTEAAMLACTQVQCFSNHAPGSQDHMSGAWLVAAMPLDAVSIPQDMKLQVFRCWSSAGCLLSCSVWHEL